MKKRNRRPRVAKAERVYTTFDMAIKKALEYSPGEKITPKGLDD